MATENPHRLGIMARLGRLFRHRLQDQHVRNCFSAIALERIATAVTHSEAHHSGQVRVCIEASLPTSYIWRGLTPRDRALTLFGKYRVWDTEHRNGVLMYLLLAEHAIEIVADRGLAVKLLPQELAGISQAMTQSFRTHDFEAGVLAGIAALDGLLRTHFPKQPGQTYSSELDDHPMLL